MRATFLEFVREQLAPLGEIRVKRMFGGHGVYRGESFFAIVHKGRLFFRTDPADRVHYAARGSREFMPRKDLKLGTYWEVPADVLDDPELVLRWARCAAARPPAKRPARRAARGGSRRKPGA
jgi:DNA transformation protein